MIFVDRHKIEAPYFFNSNERNILIGEQQRYYDIDKEKRGQRSFKGYRTPSEILDELHSLFNNRCAYCESKVKRRKEDISKSHYPNIPKGEDENFSITSHFRPRSNAKGIDKSDASVDHYWWLSYEWNNFYLSCFRCYMNKSNWFPLEGKRTDLLANYETTLKNEENLLIDPCIDNPLHHLGYDFTYGTILPKSRKGQITIEILGLNRKVLVSRRSKAIKEESINLEFVLSKKRLAKLGKSYLSEELNTLLTRWTKIFDGTSDLEFLGARRQVIANRLTMNSDLKDFVKDISNNYRKTGVLIPDKIFELDITLKENIKTNLKNIGNFIFKDEGDDKDDIKGDNLELEKRDNIKEYSKGISNIRGLLKNVHIEKIELQNYKCFESLNVEIPKIDFNDGVIGDNLKESWLVFLGENGVGKSSLIKAIAIALVGQKYLDILKLDPTQILKHGEKEGYIKVYGAKQNEFYQVDFTSEKITSSIEEPACFLLGYGSTRLLPKGVLVPETGSDYAKCKNLFDYSISMSDTKDWIIGLSKSEFDEVSNSLKNLLLLDDEDEIKINPKSKSLYINYSRSNNQTDIGELSDGYKSIFALTIDLIRALSLRNLTFKEAEAVVLLDEIGAHLHPRWKMEVVKRLRKTFPRIQFIITTHEPLCLRGLKKNEVVVLKRNEEHEIITITDLPNPSDFRVDQLLTSEYFGLNSTLDFETEEKFKEYYELLAKETKTSEEEERIIKLSQELPNKIGNDIRDELVYHVIDELLAKQIKNQGFKLADDTIKAEAVNRVKEIWDFIDNHDQS